MASVTVTQHGLDFPPGPVFHSPKPAQSKVVGDIIRFIENEYRNGNTSVTKEKLLKLQDLQASSRAQTPQTFEPQAASTPLRSPAVPAPLYPALFHKFQHKVHTPKPAPRRKRPWTFKRAENTVIAALEALANVLDNLHLLLKMPMFPKALVHLLKHTNRLWVLILVFLVRKTLSQLLNVKRKETKVAAELTILQGNANSKLLHAENEAEGSVLRRYEKALKDLAFDKMMLRIELVGNLLDLAFNAIELYDFPVPAWFMSMLNFASMGMTIYRMNKDDEYVDDDILDDIL